jgi:RNA polymerase sigma-70 factor, ECF subfamily
VSHRGGKRAAALNPIYGADKVMRFFAGILRKNDAFSSAQTRPAVVSGLAGFVVREEDGAIDTLAFAHRDGRITVIYATRNPDKLQHLRF